MSHSAIRHCVKACARPSAKSSMPAINRKRRANCARHPSGNHHPTTGLSMNLDLERLHSYPFNKLARLKEGLVPPADLAPIALSIGEPRHAPPDVVVRELIAHLDDLALYPSSKGISELRGAIAGWLTRSFALPHESLDPERHVLPVSGTREALF